MRHSKSAIFLHFVWGTWDRMPLLIGERERMANRTIGAKCQELKTEIVAFGNVEDHVHLLVNLPTTLCAADFIKLVKGASAHTLNQQGPNDVLFRWQGAYGVFSVSLTDIEVVSNYIHHQREHHQAGTLIADWEMPMMNAQRSPPF